MKKNTIIISCLIVLFILAIAAYIFLINKSNSQNPQDLTKVSDSQIISLLNKNSDAQKYMQSNAEFKIQDKIILTKESILAGQNGQTFKEVYSGLESENNRYMKVDLMNAAGDHGLVEVLDFKTQTTIKAYGIILIKTNGQTASPTTNK